MIAIQEAVVEQGKIQELEQRIKAHFQRLEQEAEKDRLADRQKTMEMFRELTKPAPRLDWWVLLYVPLLLLAAGYLLFGKESYAS